MGDKRVEPAFEQGGSKASGGFLKILIRGLILLIALIINVYAERLRTARSDERAS